MLEILITIKICIIIIILSTVLILLKQIDRIGLLINMEVIFLNIILISECYLIYNGNINFEKLALLSILIAGGDSAIILSCLYTNKDVI